VVVPRLQAYFIAPNLISQEEDGFSGGRQKMIAANDLSIATAL
jgi:hypothetical protein